MLRVADEIFVEEVRRAGVYERIGRASPCPAVWTVAMGDGRTYDEVVALRAVTSTDGMTADCSPFARSSWGTWRRGSSTR